VKSSRRVLSPVENGQSQSKVTAQPGIKTRNSTGAEDMQSSALAPLMTLQAVAAHCLVSIWTVRGWVDAGKLPVLRLPGRLIRVKCEDLARFLEACAP